MYLVLTADRMQRWVKVLPSTEILRWYRINWIWRMVITVIMRHRKQWRVETALMTQIPGSVMTPLSGFQSAGRSFRSKVFFFFSKWGVHPDIPQRSLLSLFDLTRLTVASSPNGAQHTGHLSLKFQAIEMRNDYPYWSHSFWHGIVPDL